MQYYRPPGSFFVGDCMPFYHEGVFHLYYLLDENHHQSKGGLGAHQWAHASTRDLVHWQHHPLALPITEEWEGSICTGSVFHHKGTFYAFYATRMPDWAQHLGLATSADGIHFAKSPSNPLASPAAGYAPEHYRDPCVFLDERSGLFHMLVTASLVDYPLRGRGGCLAHLVSHDLRHWELKEPFLVPGYLGVPECPDFFGWNGWYYLVFSINGVARYRMSRSPFGPWLRPRVDAFDGPMARVLKTAAFGASRRIGAAFLPSLADDKDDGAWLYAGNAVFREIIQHGDGSLGCRFPAEMAPASGAPLSLPFTALAGGVRRDGSEIRVAAQQGLGVAMLEGVPHDASVTVTCRPERGTAAYGLCFRGSGAFERGYSLRLCPNDQSVALQSTGGRRLSGDRSISCVGGLETAIRLEVVLQDDVLDVCIDGRRTLVSRCPELRGDRLFLFCEDGGVAFESVQVHPLASQGAAQC